MYQLFINEDRKQMSSHIALYFWYYVPSTNTATNEEILHKEPVCSAGLRCLVAFFITSSEFFLKVQETGRQAYLETEQHQSEKWDSPPGTLWLVNNMRMCMSCAYPFPKNDIRCACYLFEKGGVSKACQTRINMSIACHT